MIVVNIDSQLLVDEFGHLHSLGELEFHPSPFSRELPEFPCSMIDIGALEKIVQKST